MRAGASRCQALLRSPNALGIQAGPISGGDIYKVNFIYVEEVRHCQRRIDATVFIIPLGPRPEPAAKTSCQTAKTMPEICLISGWQESGQYG